MPVFRRLEYVAEYRKDKIIRHTSVGELLNTLERQLIALCASNAYKRGL